MATSLTHKYIPRIEQTEENLFIEEYYSSTDTKIYIDDVEQTEIGYINYSLQEQLKPIYGYSSNTFDDVAIGNRIVTGTLKMPIKNIEANNNANDIAERALDSNYLSYNNNQEELMDSIDWITDKGNVNPTAPGGDSSTYTPESDTEYEYRSKLMNLGYDIDYNSSDDKVAQIIKKFQQDHHIDANGQLTVTTRDAIDNACATSKDLPTVQIPSNTKFYLKPTRTSGYTTLSAQTVYILDSGYDDGWIYIMTADGQEGFINKNDFS